MRYRTRPGVVLTKICDVSVLIPSRAAYEACRSIQRLPPLWAATWSLLEKGDREETILRLHRILTKRSEEEIRGGLEKFCTEMAQKGYLIPLEEKEDA